MAQCREGFQHGCDVFVGEPVIAMPAFSDHGQQTPGQQLRQMIARAGGGKSGRRGKFTCVQCPAIHQHAEHGGTTGIADQRRCRRYMGLPTHD